MKRTIGSTQKTQVKKPKLSLTGEKKEDFRIQAMQVNEINSCLDNLAKLLQRTPQERLATCLIDHTIIISSDSKIHSEQSVEATNLKVKLTSTIMKYFSGLANKNTKYEKSREEVFKQICTAKLFENEEAFPELCDKIGEISRNVLNIYEANALYNINNPRYFPLILVREILCYNPSMQYFITTMYKVATFAATDFLRIEKFITANKNNPQNDLIEAFKGEENHRIFIDQAGGVLKRYKGLVQYEKTSGYIILDVDAPTVHAKTKIIEYLVYTEIIKNIVIGEKIYIGTSELGCKLCNDFAKAVNKVFCFGEEVIQVMETQGPYYDWEVPMICKDNFREQATGGHFHYAVNSEQVNKLNNLVPELKNAFKCGTLEHSKSLIDTKLLSTHEKKMKIVEFKPSPMQEDYEKGKRWDEYLIIRNDLIKKGIQADKIFLLVRNEVELEVTLNQINKPSCGYLIVLSVNSIDGAFNAANQLTGLYITTDETMKIASIKYINPFGQPINELLTLNLMSRTGIEPEDLTKGSNCSFYIKEPETSIFSNLMLGQLFYNLITYGKIDIYSLNEKTLLDTERKCKENQNYIKYYKIKGETSFTDPANEHNIVLEQNPIVLSNNTPESELAGQSSIINSSNA